MKQLKVMTIVGTRPETIRLARVIKALEDACNHVLVHTGQNYDYELNKLFFEDLDLPAPKHILSASGSNSAQTIGQVIIGVDDILEREKPDAVLVLGDTNSCMAVIAAKKRKIPSFHMEAGNRCFDLRVPEEINRRIVDHTADLNITYSSIAREYLLREGLRPDLVVKLGSPMFEVLHHYRASIDNSRILEDLQLVRGRFFVVSAHREENVDSPLRLQMLADIINQLAARYEYPIIFSAHPRTRKRLEEQKITLSSLVRILKPLGFFDYNKLQTSAKCALSDSGTITEESSILRFPALNLRDAHERPEGMEEAAVMMVGLDRARVFQALDLLELPAHKSLHTRKIVADYNVPDVSSKTVRIILSYIPYIKRVIWQEL